MNAVDVNLAGNEVHVWRAGLDVPDWQIQQFEKFLSNDEETKASRFRFSRDRRHYIAGRGLLRTILGGYTHMAPQALQFVYKTHGKPELAGGDATAPLRFNLSHSHGMVLIGVTRRHQIGIDLELVSHEINPLEICERFFSIQERKEMKALPADILHEGFFACWTRKEAYLKGKGLGLSAPLQEFAVSLHPRKPAQLLHDNTDPDAVNRWFFHPLETPLNYAAALVVEGHGCSVRQMVWEPSLDRSFSFLRGGASA